MKVKVRGALFDLLAFRGLVPKRQKRFAGASALPPVSDPANELARQLHPDRQHLVVAGVKDETKTARTFRLVVDQDSTTQRLAHFRAGQYLSLKVGFDGATITRPYSISSAPHQSLGEGAFYEITVRQAQDGFLTGHMWDHWDVGTKVVSSGPLGFFYHEPLRDAQKIVGLAGGSGITPFRSMAREIVHGDLELELVLLYGSSAEDDIIFYDELKELEEKSRGRVRVVHVLSCEEVSLAGCEQGFITAGTIRKHAAVERSSFFVCGPQAMYRFVAGELAELNLPRRRIRREAYGEGGDGTAALGFPLQMADATFRLRVHVGGAEAEVPARATETVLVALERAGLTPPSQCRSGECGFCRALLVGGQVYTDPETDGRRAADRRFGYVHPCASYPLSDLELVVPRDV